MSDPILLLKLLLLVGIANGSPILAKRLLKDRLDMPLDSGLTLRDGYPVFGPSKTFRGLAASMICTACLALLLGLGWRLGVAIAAGSMLGDLMSSFAKRRLHLKSQAQAFGLDQVPEALLPLLAVKAPLNLTYAAIAGMVLAFLVLELVLSRILFLLGVRDRPY